MSAPPMSADVAVVPPGATTRSGTRRRISWDVLRVGFVLLVMLYHGTFIGPLVYEDLIPRNLVFAHQVGASLLLVLSAYFVAATVRRAGTGRWWWGKVARLVPAFVVATLLAFVVLRLVAPGGWYFPTKKDLAANLLMLWNWNGVVHWDYVDGSYWTIPVQLMAFTVAALLWRSPLGRGIGLRVLMWAALIVPLAQWWPHLTSLQGTYYSVLSNGFGLHRWHLFVAGVAIWMVSTRRLGRAHFAALLTTCVVAHAVHTAWLTPEGGVGTDRVAVAGVTLGMLAILAAATGPDWDRVVPRAVRPAITWLAGISYGVFLVHQTVGYVVMRRLQQVGVGPTLQTGAMLVTGVLLGWAMTRLVEGPSHRALMRGRDRCGSWVGSWFRQPTPSTTSSVTPTSTRS